MPSRKLYTIITISALLLLGAISFGIWRAKSSTAINRAGLVGYWTLDVNDSTATKIMDKSGNNKNGTPLGFYAGRAPTSTPGKVKEAISFDGANGYIQIPNAMTAKAPYTVAYWFKANEDNASNGYAMLSFADSAHFPYFRWGFGAGKVLYYGDADSFIYTNSIPNPVGTWHHFVGSIASNATIAGTKLYIDGQDYTGAVTSDIGTASEPGPTWAIGATTNGVIKFNGSLDDVRVYNYALSAQEAKNLYSSAKVTHESAATHSATTTSSGRLVGWWTLDQNDIRYGGNATTTYDKSGSGFTGTFSIGANTYGTTSTPGKIGTALNFDGQNDYIGLGDSSILQPVYITVGGWFKTSASNAQEIIRKRSGGYTLMMNSNNCPQPSAGKVSFLIYSGVETLCAQSTLTFNDNKWHHAVGTFDGLNIKIYVDGTLSGTTPAVTSIVYLAGAIAIGRDGDNSANYWNGAIDDVRIYNYVMSAQEITQLYNSSARNYVSAPPRDGLVLWYKMDNSDSTATNVFDKSGFNNTGTPLGFYTGQAPTSTLGKIKEAIQFDGRASISFPITASLPSTFNTITTSAWIKSTATTYTNQRVWLYFYPGTYAIFDASRNPFCSYSIGTQKTLSSNMVAEIGKWYLVTCTYDGSSFKIYVNGVFKNQITGLSGTVNASDATRYVGRYSNTADNRWIGSIDDVRVYNRALSAAEIMSLYQSANVNNMK